MKVFAFACIIFAVCISTSLQRTPFYPCYIEGRHQPTPKSVTVLGCSSRPCEFIAHTNFIAKWDFVAQTNAKSLRTEVKVITNKIVITYPWINTLDTCKSLSNEGCPLKKGKIATSNINMDLFSLTPLFTPFFYEFKLLDENNRVQVCFRLYSKFI